MSVVSPTNGSEGKSSRLSREREDEESAGVDKGTMGESAIIVRLTPEESDNVDRGLTKRLLALAEVKAEVQSGKYEKGTRT